MRIIGGSWRGRKIAVLDDPALRPTPDRVRETLFNWLSPVISGAHCLDLFAGSGILGFEALSRGAGSVTLVEQNRKTAEMLRKQAQILEANSADVICEEAFDYLARAQKKFDIVFLDPPFRANLLLKTCETLRNRGHLHSDSLIYIESDTDIAIKPPYTMVKQARAGNIQYMLLGYDPGSKPE